VLRCLFGEPKRSTNSELQEVLGAIDAFTDQFDENACYELAPGKQERCLTRQGRLLLWAKGFRTALDELEQSKYCSERYGAKIQHRYVEEMEEEERDDYYRHIYFYKNAFIRVFSILDKLGYFLNEWYQLKTERVKRHFSYFTVLRRMRERRAEPQLEAQLVELKERYQEPMNRLRQQRNMEIHWINSELKDEWSDLSLHYDRIHIENLKANEHDLEQGFQMVRLTLLIVFRHISRNMQPGGMNRG